MGRSVTDSLWAAIGRYDQALQASTAIGVAAGVTYGRAAQLETDAQILRSGDYAKFQDLLSKCGD